MQPVRTCNLLIVYAAGINFGEEEGGRLWRFNSVRVHTQPGVPLSTTGTKRHWYDQKNRILAGQAIIYPLCTCIP